MTPRPYVWVWLPSATEPLVAGRLEGLRVAGPIRDAGPDAWGQRVIVARRTGRLTRERDTGDSTCSRT